MSDAAERLTRPARQTRLERFLEPRDWYAAMGLPLPPAELLELRGAWDRDGRFYQRGFALTDWWNDYSVAQRAAYRRRQRARNRGLAVRGGPVLGSGGRHGGV